jgi:hypothetical protein
VRQWARVVALLLGLAGTGYIWTARSRPPVPIERQLSADELRRTTGLTQDWWLA